MATVYISPDLLSLGRQLQATARQVVKIEQRTVRKTLRWAAVQTARGIARANRVPLGAMYGTRISGGGSRPRNAPQSRRAARIRVTMPNAGHADGAVWIGYAGVKASYIGKLRDVPGGARAGRQFFERAFVAQMRSGHVGIFRRIPGTRGRSGREKLKEQFAQLDRAQSVVDDVQARIPQRLNEVARQELRYELLVRGQ